MAPKVLVVLTSHDQLGTSGKPTGWYLPELAHPYDEFIAAGLDVTVASPAGGPSPVDPSSIEATKDDPSSVKFLNDSKPLYQNTAKLSTIASNAADEFDALFYPGGHGPMFDLATDKESQQLIADFVAKGKVVSAVCHGPAVFANVKDPRTGESVLHGKEVTAFSNTEEDMMQLSQFMPFSLEDKLVEAGAKFVKADEPWGAKVVVDGQLITGQNPASAKGVGEAIVKAVGAKK